MDFKFTTEEEAFRREVRHMLSQELPPGYQGPIWLDGFFDSDSMWDLNKAFAHKLGERGWLCLTWPKEYGGQGVDDLRPLILWDEVYYQRAPGLDIFGLKMLSPILLAFGTPEQKQRHLPPIAQGEVFWCQGYSEPNAGTDLAGVQTRAVETEDGFIVNGQKIWTSGAHRADWIFVLCRTDPQAGKHGGLSLILIDMRTPGVTVNPLVNIVGARSFNEIFFDNVKVPRENLVGGEGGKNQGWHMATTLLNHERSGVERAAAARRFVADLVAYAQSSPRPLSAEMRLRLAEAAVDVEASRLLAYRVGWMRAQGLEPQGEASMSKVYLSELLQRLANLGCQVLGLHAQMEGEGAPLGGGAENLYMATLGGTIAAGTSEIQRMLIAHRGLGLPRG
ncbi:MAG: acyl-CoA dehydrogenase family protein [Dehalococcoidia bacterium]